MKWVESTHKATHLMCFQNVKALKHRRQGDHPPSPLSFILSICTSVYLLKYLSWGKGYMHLLGLVEWGGGCICKSRLQRGGWRWGCRWMMKKGSARRRKYNKWCKWRQSTMETMLMLEEAVVMEAPQASFKHHRYAGDEASILLHKSIYTWYHIKALYLKLTYLYIILDIVHHLHTL